MMENNAKWALKISKLQEEIGSLKADGQNTFAKWYFISSNQLKKHLNDLMPNIGLICIPQVINHEESIFQTKKGDDNTRTIVTMSFEIMDTETGFSKVFEFRGADSDNSKSYAQAITDCFKRFWFNLLCISEEKEDADYKTAGQRASQAERNEFMSKLNKFVIMFRKLGVEKSDLENRVKKDYKNFNDSDIDELKKYYEEVKDGNN